MIGASLASVAILSALPATAAAGDQWIFRAPEARPTDHPDPNRNAYTVPEAPRSPACTRHFCVHWVAEAARVQIGTGRLLQRHRAVGRHDLR